MYHPQVGELMLYKDRLTIDASDGLVLVIYHAAPGTDTAEKLALLASLAAPTVPVSSSIAIDATDG
jgi:hypothetical protein